LAGGTHKPKDLPNPSPDWLSDRSWGDILTLAALPKFAAFAEDFPNHLQGFKKIFDSGEPHKYESLSYSFIGTMWNVSYCSVWI